MERCHAFADQLLECESSEVETIFERVVCEDYRHSINGSVIPSRLAQRIRTTDGCYPTQIMFKGSTQITTLCKECSHILRFNQEVIIIGAKSMQSEELAVRDTMLALLRMKRREMEVVMSICSLVEYRGLNLTIRNE